MCRNGGDGTRHNKTEEKVEKSTCGSEQLNMYVYKQEGRRKKVRTHSQGRGDKRNTIDLCVCCHREKNQKRKRGRMRAVVGEWPAGVDELKRWSWKKGEKVTFCCGNEVQKEGVSKQQVQL